MIDRQRLIEPRWMTERTWSASRPAAACVQHLHGNGRVEIRVVVEPHLGETAGAEGLDLVQAPEGLGKGHRDFMGPGVVPARDPPCKPLDPAALAPRSWPHAG